VKLIIFFLKPVAIVLTKIIIARPHVKIYTAW